MILDYSYNKRDKLFKISYIDGSGHKKFLEYNAGKFKSYEFNDEGEYTNWDGRKCDISYINNPSSFDIKTFITELPDADKKLLSNSTFPKLYTFDIETDKVELSTLDHNGNPIRKFSEASEGSGVINTISIVNPKLDCIVLGLKKISDEEDTWIKEQFNNYLNNTDFYKTLDLGHTPKFTYIYFSREDDMLIYFLKNIVCKVPILAGWNCIFYDWQYIVNRIKNYFQGISLNISSSTKSMSNKRYVDMKGNEVVLPMPDHTLILDMMDVVATEDFSVMPIKESRSLDYIASESIGINKIKYEGDLEQLQNENYPKYVYYNAIDSVLVQLINHRFKCLDHIYLFALYCNEKIGRMFSKIAITESLVFNQFYSNGLKVVYNKKERDEDFKIQGAYVKQPVKGLHKFVSCNDFASLYPSTIRTCNLSFENFVGPAAAFTEEQLSDYKKDPNYFVSVNNNVYKNDKEYTFKIIQNKLKDDRNRDKYLKQKIERSIVADVEHILEYRLHEISKDPYEESVLNNIQDILELEKYSSILNNKSLLENHANTPTISSKGDLKEVLKNVPKDILKDLLVDLKKRVVYLDNSQTAVKLIMNSMYGGCGNKNFYFFNPHLASDITGESRNLTHMMEHHISDYFRQNWLNMRELHEKLGITVSTDPGVIKKSLGMYKYNKDDADAYNQESFVNVVYGDTDSLYISYEPLLNTIEGELGISEKRDIIVNINKLFLDSHNKQFIHDYYKERFGDSVHDFELELVLLSGIWLDVKKRYAGLVLWQDGKVFDEDHLKMKVKGLEISKGSFPKKSREILAYLVRYLLQTASEPNLQTRLNSELMKCKEEFMNASVDDISCSIKINNYQKYIENDKGSSLKVLKGCPFNVRAAGYRNWLIDKHSIQDAVRIEGGLVKWYYVKDKHSRKTCDEAPQNAFVFNSMNWDEWASMYAPIDKNYMFQHTVINPLNRIIEPTSLTPLQIDGSFMINLFNF